MLQETFWFHWENKRLISFLLSPVNNQTDEINPAKFPMLHENTRLFLLNTLMYIVMPTTKEKCTLDIFDVFINQTLHYKK